MSKYDEARVGGGDKTPLPAGQYGTNTEPGLEVLSFIGSKETKSAGLKRHSFLVGASNGTEGTAFLALQWKDDWLRDAAMALAFSKPEWAPQEEQDACLKAWYEESVLASQAANVPPEEAEKWCEKHVDNIKTQIRINVGTLFRLQDWTGKERDPSVQLGALRGIQFSGVIEKGVSGDSMEVKSVISRKKEKKADNPFTGK
jgi:hypothetical protein